MTKQSIEHHQAHDAFQHVQTVTVDSLAIHLNEYRHRVTGARHFHLASNHSENVFLVGFPTLPMDSMGIAHILEHTLLCGSKKYPVRDPFFMMIRRSLNTFMNAFTSSDWTAFPFATQNKKDFQNLLNVYLDAVFFPLLDPLDFAQEGHRLEFEKGSDPTTPLMHKGVVYNEMKGAMSTPIRQAYTLLKQHLFPTTTYHYNSGGDPAVIPRLSYQQLMEFYTTHYHPSNAIFMTFGDIPAHEHQATFESACLSQFTAGQKHQAGPEIRRFSPLTIEEAYGTYEPDTGKDCHIIIGWLLEEPQHLDQMLEYTLIGDLLLGNSAAPLRQALETCGIGSPSPLNGLMASGLEPMFATGIQGAARGDVQTIHTIVFDTIAAAILKGFDTADIEATLFQLEMGQREISGSSQPYGLELILEVFGHCVYDKPVDEILDITPSIQRLRQSLQDPEYLQQRLKSMLIDNQHQVHLTLYPNEQLLAQEQASLAAQLDKQKQNLTPEAVQALVDKAKALADRQAQIDDPSILPKVGLDDIPAEMYIAQASTLSRKQPPKPITVYEAPTNGMSYFKVITPLPKLNLEQIQHLNLLHLIWTEVGAGGQDYLQTQKNHYCATGHLSASLSIRANGTSDRLSAYTLMSSKTLNHRFDDMLKLTHEQYFNPRFDEIQRIREMALSQRQNLIQSIPGRGHSLAMNAASAVFHPVSEFSFNTSGLAFIQATKLGLESIENNIKFQQTIQEIQNLHQLIIQQNREFLLVGHNDNNDINTMIDISIDTDNTVEIDTNDIDNESNIETWMSAVDQLWQPGKNTSAFHQPASQLPQKQAWLTSTQVNFCAMALPVVDKNHPDAPALAVLAPLLKNNILHTAIREIGGAYGGGASYNSQAQTFEFYSYRDPRIAETFADYEASIEWAIKGEFQAQQVEEAILSLISMIDKPASPSGEAVASFFMQLHGRSPEEAQAYRQAIQAVSIGDLVAVSKKYLQNDKKSQVVITNTSNWQAASLQGFTEFTI